MTLSVGLPHLEGILQMHSISSLPGCPNTPRHLHFEPVEGCSLLPHSARPGHQPKYASKISWCTHQPPDSPPPSLRDPHFPRCPSTWWMHCILQKFPEGQPHLYNIYILGSGPKLNPSHLSSSNPVWLEGLS